VNLTIRTASGSKYVVTEEPDGLRVNREEGGAHYTGRACLGRLALSVEAEVGKPAVFYWGTGRDEFSPDGTPLFGNRRTTETSKVVGITVGTGEPAHYVLHTVPGAS
jgi:hypothetical protein